MAGYIRPSILWHLRQSGATTALALARLIGTPHEYIKPALRRMRASGQLTERRERDGADVGPLHAARRCRLQRRRQAAARFLRGGLDDVAQRADRLGDRGRPSPSDRAEGRLLVYVWYIPVNLLIFVC